MNSDVNDDLLNRMSNVCDKISCIIKYNVLFKLSSKRILSLYGI